MRDSSNIILEISNLYIYIMVKSYCVRQKKVTECVPGSERYERTKNSRTMLKCIGAECGIVQAFYRQKSVNLPLIAKERFLTVFGPGTCPL